MNNKKLLGVRLGLSLNEHQDFENQFHLKYNVPDKARGEEILDQSSSSNCEKEINLEPNGFLSKLSNDEFPLKNKPSVDFSNLQTTLKNKMVRAAYNKLKRSMIFASLSSFKPLNFLIINDLSFFWKNAELKINKTLLLLEKLSKKMFINPYSYKTMIWKLLIFIFLLFLFVFIPFEISFFQYYHQKYSFVYIYWIALYVIIIDIFMKLNTGIFSNGCLVKKRLEILTNYLKQYFFFDLIGVFVISYALIFTNQLNNRGIQLLKLLIFLKTPELINYYYEIFQYFRLERSLKNFFELTKIFSISLCVAHIVACLWHFVAVLSKDYDESISTWLDLIDLKNSQIVYLYSLYWSIVTMMTVGYGDITPKNPFEIFFSMLALMVGCAVYAYNLNSIGMILQKMYKESNDFHENISIISGFMDRKKIDKDLNMRVREYLKFLWHEKKIKNNDAELEIINTLNKNLKFELLLEAYGGIFKAFPMLYKNFSEESLKKMVEFMKELRFTPGDAIFVEKESDDCSLYFINHGCVDLLICGSNMEMNSVFHTYKAGDVFGEAAFFTGQSQAFTARCKEYVNVFEIKRDDFIRILKENPIDYEKFCMIKDQITFYNNYKNIKLKCFSCGSFEHHSLKCPRIYFKADVEKIVKKHEFSFLQERKFFIRPSKKNNSLKKIKDISKKAKKYQKFLENEEFKLSYKFQKKIMNLNSKNWDSEISLDDVSSLESIDMFHSVNLGESIAQINQNEDQGEEEKIDKIHELPVIIEKSEEEISTNKTSNAPICRSNQKAFSLLATKEMEESFSEKQFFKLNSQPKLSPPKDNDSGNNNNKSIPKIQSMIKNDTANEFSFFEKSANLKEYFPDCNVDIILKNYDRKRKKIMYTRKMNQYSYLHTKTNTDLSEKLKNLGKYCFFSEEIKKKILNYKDNIKTKVLSAQENINQGNKNEAMSPAKKSAFFKRQEFQNKSKENFATFVAKVFQMARGNFKKK